MWSCIKAYRQAGKQAQVQVKGQSGGEVQFPEKFKPHGKFDGLAGDEWNWE